MPSVVLSLGGALAAEVAPVVTVTPLPLKWVLLAGLAAGVLRFVWGAICWMVLKHHDDDWRGVGDDGGVEAALAKADLAPGWFYLLPFHKDVEGGARGKAFAERMARGPNAMIVALPAGGCMGGAVFLKGFLLNLLEGLGLALLVCVLWDSRAVHVDTLGETMAGCAAVGLLASISVHFMASVWMGMPWRHTWSSTFDLVVGYALAGGLLYWLAGPVGLL